jgi:hypothetical protein
MGDLVPCILGINRQKIHKDLEYFLCTWFRLGLGFLCNFFGLLKVGSQVGQLWQQLPCASWKAFWKIMSLS